MPKIVFFDTEIEPGTGKILDIGAIRETDLTSHKQVGTT